MFIVILFLLSGLLPIVRELSRDKLSLLIALASFHIFHPLYSVLVVLVFDLDHELGHFGLVVLASAIRCLL